MILVAEYATKPKYSGVDNAKGSGVNVTYESDLIAVDGRFVLRRWSDPTSTPLLLRLLLSKYTLAIVLGLLVLFGGK